MIVRPTEPVRRDVRHRVGAARVPQGASRHDCVRRGVAGPERDLPRVDRRARARDGDVHRPACRSGRGSISRSARSRTIPVTFRVSAAAERQRAGDPLLERHGHDAASLGADGRSTSPRFAGQTVTLALLAGVAVEPGRSDSGARRSSACRTPAARIRRRVGARRGTPRGVILIQADTLRRDHLDAYGYSRETAPTLKRLAGEGVAVQATTPTQATWTKVSTPSLMTSLYPVDARRRRLHRSSAGVRQHPGGVVTGPPATRRSRSSSVLFTGQFTNLHQGFEELHEDGSLPTPGSSKTAREFVDRLPGWLETHRDGRSSCSSTSSIRTTPTSRARRTTRCGPIPAHKEEHEQQAKEVTQVHQGPAAAAVRHAVARRAAEGRLRSGTRTSSTTATGTTARSARMDVEIGRLVERLRAARPRRRARCSCS